MKECVIIKGESRSNEKRQMEDEGRKKETVQDEVDEMKWEVVLKDMVKQKERTC